MDIHNLGSPQVGPAEHVSPAPALAFRCLELDSMLHEAQVTVDLLIGHVLLAAKSA